MTIEMYLSDLATYLRDQGFGTLGRSETGTSIQVSGYHDSSNNAIFITPYGGADKDEIVSGEEDASRPDFQILVRNLDPGNALSISSAIYRLLRKKVEWDIGSTHFIYLRGKAPPIFVRKTNSGYSEYSINFSAILS